MILIRVGFAYRFFCRKFSTAQLERLRKKQNFHVTDISADTPLLTHRKLVVWPENTHFDEKWSKIGKIGKKNGNFSRIFLSLAEP